MRRPGKVSEMSDEDLMAGFEIDEDLGPAGEDTDLGDETEPCCETLEVEMMQATNTAIGSLQTVDFAGSQSAIGSALVEGDAEISSSLIGMVTAGSVELFQGAAGVVMVDGDASVEQGAAQVLVARTATIESGGAGVLVTGDAALARSWVGVMAARNAEISEDSRVIIDVKAALIIGAFLFGGLGLVAAAMLMGARRVASRMPHLPLMHHGHGGAHAMRMPHLHMPDMPKLPDLPKMPDLPNVADLVAKLRRAV